jgi:hypothetical protein
MKYNNRELIINEGILIISGDQSEILGVAKYKGDVDGSPSFKLKGKVIYGYECWWIPEKEADNVRREVLKNERSKK